jgi:hypothetical protein
MSDVFDLDSSGKWSFQAEASTILKTTALALAPRGLGVRFAKGPDVKPRHGARYWSKVTAGFDFSDADRVPPARFNKVLWDGLMSGKLYPALMGRRVSEKSDD